MSKFIENKFFVFLLLIIFIIHQYIFQNFFPNSKGLLGHDYEYFMPTFIYGKIWFFNNFLSIPWFTPSFCCGIPFYADPQSMYFSIPQIIFLLFDPIVSLKLIFLFLSAVGYIGMFFGLNYSNLISGGKKYNKQTRTLGWIMLVISVIAVGFSQSLTR